MNLCAHIRGMGWVFSSSMGRPDRVQLSLSGDHFPELTGKSVLKNPYKPFGRMDNFSKMGFAAIAFAMDHAGISPSTTRDGVKKKRNIALIAGSETGCLETDLLYQATLSRAGGALPSPALFAYTLPSCFLGEASIYFGLTGESYMVEEENMTGLTPLSMAMDCLESGLYRAVVCGVCNSELTKTDSPPGALFLVLESIDNSDDNPGDPAVPVLTRSPGNKPLFHLGKREIKTLVDFFEYVF
ncbi:MAG: beta-ketoacyl synthase N-terminal-like domain-containing protein [Desulfobacterium sp.]|nr:beta-ketoacyl synthase N-terminal-like domain-containing protein [Desulfobacterium sp.]